MDDLCEHLFWDGHRASINTETHAPLLTARVLEYGRWKDWKILAAHYGKPRLATLATGLRTISPKSLAFCCAWFQLPPSAFRCSAGTVFPAGDA